MSSSKSPCAACKFLRRKCTEYCTYAPYFPPDYPERFVSVHNVFGGSNVNKLLNELDPAQREEAVNSLVYEAEERIKDPIYGCIRELSRLQKTLKSLQSDLYHRKKELSTYMGPQAMVPMSMPQTRKQHQIQQEQQGRVPMIHRGGGQLDSQCQQHLQRLPHQHRQDQIIEVQQFAPNEQKMLRAFSERKSTSSIFDQGHGSSGFNQNINSSANEQEMLRAYSHQEQHPQEEIVWSTDSIFDPGHGSVSATTGFNQNIDTTSYNSFQIRPQESHQPDNFGLLQPLPQPFHSQQRQEQRSGNQLC